MEQLELTANQNVAQSSLTTFSSQLSCQGGQHISATASREREREGVAGSVCVLHRQLVVVAVEAEAELKTVLAACRERSFRSWKHFVNNLA